MRLFVFILGFLFSGCGETYHPEVYQNGYINPNNYITVKRGYFAGCSGRIVNISYDVIGKVYTLSPLICGHYQYNYLLLQESVLQ